MKTLMNISTPDTLQSSKQFGASHQAYGREVIVQQIPQSLQPTCQLKSVIFRTWRWFSAEVVFWSTLKITQMNFKCSGGILLHLCSIQPFILITYIGTAGVKIYLIYAGRDYFCVIVFENTLTDKSPKNIMEGEWIYIQITCSDSAPVGFIKGHYCEVLLCNIYERRSRSRCLPWLF